MDSGRRELSIVEVSIFVSSKIVPSNIYDMHRIRLYVFRRIYTVLSGALLFDDPLYKSTSLYLGKTAITEDTALGKHLELNTWDDITNSAL